MSKLIVLVMDQEYPFTETQVAERQSFNVLVRQVLLTNPNTKPMILAKANFLKNLRNKYLVKVESLME